jgi:hypothetical protein
MTLRFTANNQTGAVWPLLVVHKTILHTLGTAVENIEARWTPAVVHLNAFFWTLRVLRGREAEA